MEHPITVENLCFDYGDEPVLGDAGFVVEPGCFAALVGANGAGKSTLLKLLLGELSPASGSVRLWGEDVRRFKDWPRVGYVPQNGVAVTQGFPATAGEIVLLNLYSKIGRFRPAGKTHRETARKALAAVGMERYSRKMMGELSGGQVQRVMIARALAAGCDLMLLDEPVTGMDSASALALYELLRDLNKRSGLTIVMVSHDMARASRYVDRVLLLEDGKIISQRGEE